MTKTKRYILRTGNLEWLDWPSSLVRRYICSHSVNPNPFVDLSQRELEVLRLIASGLSNSEIAARLVISEKTVKGHLSNILSKLHPMDRTQAAVFAWRQGLIRREQ